MAAPATNDLDVWQYQVPVITANADGDFDVWYLNVPVEDRDVARTTNTTQRRRAFEF